MASLPFMKFYISDYLVDTQHLTTIEHGAYLLLIMTYFQSGKSLPDNDQKLARFCKLSVTKFQKMKPTLKEFFSISGGEWVHKRIENDLDEISRKSGMARDSALKRWQKTVENLEAEDDANAMRTQCERNAMAMLTEQIRTEQTRKEQNIASHPAPDFSVSEIFEFWKKTMGHEKAILDKTRISKIKTALKWGYTPQQLKNAILGCSGDEWHMGKNPNKKRYDKLSLIFRSSDKIDGFIEAAERSHGALDQPYCDNGMFDGGC